MPESTCHLRIDNYSEFGRRRVSRSGCAFIVLFISCGVAAISQTDQNSTATVTVDPAEVVGHVNRDLYGAFMEMMAWDVKYGLYAEMLHDRSFEEPTDHLGLPRGWNLEPDERNDSIGTIRFSQTADAAYPRINAATGKAEQSLRVTLSAQDASDMRRGV